MISLDILHFPKPRKTEPSVANLSPDVRNKYGPVCVYWKQTFEWIKLSLKRNLYSTLEKYDWVNKYIVS